MSKKVQFDAIATGSVVCTSLDQIMLPATATIATANTGGSLNIVPSYLAHLVQRG
jgi:hypothetical protein